jgi:intein/homing endonuclease
MQQTPVIGTLPKVLRRKVKPEPTPVIDGTAVRPVSDLINAELVSDADISAAVQLAGVSPESDPAWAGAQANLMEHSCAYFAAETIRGPREAPYNGKFILGRHHLEWDDLINDHMRLNILAARDHGKCRVAGSLVQSADGRRVPVENWGGGNVVGYDMETHELRSARSSASQRVGKAECYRIQTRTGRVETVADWHKFIGPNGFILADELQVGQRIGVPKTLPTAACQRWMPGAAWLLGLLIGDGGMTSCSPSLTIEDELIVDAATEAAARQGWELTGSDIQFRLTARWAREDSPKSWLADLGIWGKLSAEKCIPDEVFTLDPSEIGEILAGWLDADGHVNLHGGGSVEWYSVSEQLIRDGLHLLTRLGVVAVMSPKRGRYGGKDHWSWRLTVRGESIGRLARQVRPRGLKGDRLKALAGECESKQSAGSVDLLPAEIYDWLDHGSDWTRRRGGPRFSRKYSMTRDKARRIADVQGNDRLGKLAAAEILWDEVVEVEAVGLHDVYALQVAELGTYVGQDIINGNSYFFTIAYSIWKAGYNEPGSYGVIFSATQPQAEEFLGKIKDELLSNPKLAHLVPYTGDRFWSARKITLRNGSVIRAAGFGVKIRGGHPDWCVCDDVLNDDDIYSETIRRRNIDYFLSAISGMVHRKKQLIVVGTPMHHGDLYAALAVTGEYECRSYPALTKGVPLWPERYSLEDLEAKKRELVSAARFAREFLCQPLSDEASLFPSKLFEGPEVRLPYVLGLPAQYWEEKGCMRYTGVDIALSAETGADYFVIFTVAVDPSGVRYLANIRRGKGWSFTRQIDEIKEEHYLMHPEVIHIEANQMQRVWTDEIARTTDLPVKRFFTLGIGGRQPMNSWKKGATSVMVNKHHIDRGVPGLRISLEHRKWRIPRGDARSIELTDIWIGEMGAIGWIDGKVQTVGEHDDMPMACWMCDTAIRMGGGTFDWLEGSMQDKSKDLMAAPKVVDQEAISADYLEAERHCLAACQERRPIDCTPDAYMARVRSAMQNYSEQLIDADQMAGATHVLQEIKRLDAKFRFRSYAAHQTVAQKGNGEYREWAPDEKAPTIDDLGIG